MSGPLAALAAFATIAFLGATLAAPDFDYVDDVIYKNALTGGFMFCWGAVTYVVLRDTNFRIPFALGAPLILLGLYYFYAWSASDLFGADHKSSNAFIANILLGIPVSAAVCLTVTPQALKSWEARLGDLSYGIYLNHFLVAGLLLWLAEAIGGEPFGRYGRASFGLVAILACALFAALTFHVVERPIEVLRRKIKARGESQAHATAERKPPVVSAA